MEGKATRMAIIAAHGTLDMAYPPLILATAAAAMEMDVTIFFTFYGLEILKKGKNEHLQVAPLGNPAMPAVAGDMHVPNIVGVLPGMTAMATSMMRDWMKKANVASIPELLDMAKELGVKLVACQMTMDVLGVKKEELVEGLEIGGAATFIEFASENAITLSF